MSDFDGLLSGDYGFKSQRKSAPMAPQRSKPSAANSAFDFDFATSKAPYSNKSASGAFLDDQDKYFSQTSNSDSNRKNNDFGDLDDVLGVRSKAPTDSQVNLDSLFGNSGDSGPGISSLPVFDKPLYDDEDVFDGVAGLKNSSSAKYENIFADSSPQSKEHDAFDDLLGGLGTKEPESKGLSGSGRKNEKDVPVFDDLLPGFGSSTPHDRKPPDSNQDHVTTANEPVKAPSGMEDPFVVINSGSPDRPSSPGLYSDPLEQFSKRAGSSGNDSENASVSGGFFDDIDPLDGLGKPVPMNGKEYIETPVRAGTKGGVEQTSDRVETRGRSSSLRSPDRGSNENMPTEDTHEFPRFDTFSASVDSHRSAPNLSSPSYVNASDKTVPQKPSSTSLDSWDDVWLTVSEVPLLTEPTAAPPPSRPPPPKPVRITKAGPGSFASQYSKKKTKSAPADGKSPFESPIDGLEDFGKGRGWNSPDGNSNLYDDDLQRHSDAAASATAMKEAIGKAEAKYKHVKEAREASRMQQDRGEEVIPDFQERELRERQERRDRERKLREEESKRREEEDRLHREREEREREQRRIERERIERERVRQAVERATREARERAAAEAHARAQKSAVEKAQAEARQRAEKAAVMKAQAEARERAARAAQAAAEAKQRADREKAEREAREKSERVAKEKEARDRAAAAASARASQQKNENDLDSFFGTSSRASSATRPNPSSSDPFFDSQFPNKPSQSARTPVGSTANMRKPSPSSNIVDDLSSIFGGAPSAGGFQEFQGESEERRRARLERHLRTKERAERALAEKNQRDLEVQKEQAERHRIAETVDVEVRRWSAGKEGNLRALLSTLQYVLWPECGWQPVSLTDLITAAAVKKAYRKATLCVHPDKVQQKGATLQQKYVAEKVFDLLKEAWNKFNSEELF